MFSFMLTFSFGRNKQGLEYMADHTEFSRRLVKACENNPVVPEKGKGQQLWLAQKMDISQEAVRKYMEGLARPRPDKMTKLAKILNVDESWLALGVNPEMDQKGKRQYKSRVEAAGYLAFGVFMSNGHTCAFGEEGNDVVDFYAIKGGQQKAIAVTTARERSKGVWLFPVKPSYESTINVVVLPLKPTQFEFVYLDQAGIAEHGDYRGGMIEITAHRDARIHSTGRHTWKRLEEADVL